MPSQAIDLWSVSHRNDVYLPLFCKDITVAGCSSSKKTKMAAKKFGLGFSFT